MLIPGAILTFVLCSGWTSAQQVHTAPANTRTSLDRPSVQVPNRDHRIQRSEIQKPNFKIKSTQVKLVDVVEAPPMEGLPTTEHTIRLTVHHVADPGLPEPETKPLVEPNPKPFEFSTSEPVQPNHIAMVSATVYHGGRTKLTCRSSAGRGEVTSWSNIDFKHFRSTKSFEAIGSDGKAVTYSLLMGIVHEHPHLNRDYYEKQGLEWVGPEIPQIPDGAPAFVLETANPDPESLKLLEALHALYRDHGATMAEAAAAQKQAEEERRAYLLANPPKPKDVTINLWRASSKEEAK